MSCKQENESKGILKGSSGKKMLENKEIGLIFKPKMIRMEARLYYTNIIVTVLGMKCVFN